MNWTVLNTEEQLAEIINKSHSKAQVIFKHSIRCSISSMVKSRLEKSSAPDSIDFHYLDLINYRSLSNKIAEDLNVYHESPQVLFIKDGECIYDESHMAIRMDDIAEQVS
ncbi:MAG TPA: bacillithiol system redox-active protein YtxJ [Chitinophagaceae bacterium]|nr:bacillithiol system redox-active protein YtxJ [Chitinophagaceae bacterium]MBP6476294.1 bacillithiol system redox-active protein YtxJ [Chitinophagaceae bacterium]MBP7108091.1 bacillithiol system redox-active protein YtxJ [Chitinophagaceae bacterium]MBP7313665.1 bacillithiol system redox-active protein YtxJ [Chitinophagaceae bacterium]HQV54241.1 bacillithiol system redox-active protein YtxJ [Chitinophagaceae bacterium]